MRPVLVILGVCAFLVLFFLARIEKNPALSDFTLELESGREAVVYNPTPAEMSRLIWERKEEMEQAQEEKEFHQTGKPIRTRVCTIALNPRQGSLFRTNYLGEMGSGKYKYIARTDCPWDWPRVRLISYVKCCTKMSKVKQSINVANEEFDIIIITGDEYCHVNDGRPQFRQYHGSRVIGLSKNISTTPFLENFDSRMMDSNRYPMFIPLGPREEFLFEKIDQTSLKPSQERKYTYNFLGSMTSQSRAVLRSVLGKDLASDEAQREFPSFLHITDKWHLKVTKSNGYVEPDQYKQVLLDSIFTLCPTGHNPEAYRIYEALEAGSIPVLSLDPWYTRASCGSAFKPFMDSGAPFVYLEDGWKGLEAFLRTKGSNQTWIKEAQTANIKWYRWWMGQTALRFEALMEFRFQRRLSRGKEQEVLIQEEDMLEQEEEDAILQEEGEDEDDDDEEDDDDDDDDEEDI